MKRSYYSFISLVLIIIISCSEQEPQPQMSVDDFILSIDENPDKDQVLGMINTNNADGTLAFSLISESPEGALNLDTTTGELTVADESLFDFETNPLITAQVNVIDNKGSVNGSITITLNDLDEPSGFTIWEGPDLTFTKEDGADPSLAVNQDLISASVAITRGNDGGQIFNAIVESAANKSTSPAGTKWAIGSLDNIENLQFRSFRDTVEPKNVVGKTLILYLEAEDVYLPIVFSSWSQGKTGGFSYVRATEGN